jgi:hypothetical protein
MPRCVGKFPARDPTRAVGNKRLRARGFYSLPFYPPLHLFADINQGFVPTPPCSFKNPSACPAQYVLAGTTGAGTTITATSPNVFVEPVAPPNRSLYNFGVGIDLIQVYKQYLQSKVTISAISPANQTYTIDQAKQIQFVATVTGSSDNAVEWQLTGPTGAPKDIGKIDSSGNYTQPAAADTNQLTKSVVLTVTATAHADSSKSSTTMLTLSPK